MEFKDGLRAMLEKRGMSQSDLARGLDRSRQYVHGYIKGDYEPTFSRAVEIADVLECSLDELAGRKVELYPALWSEPCD